MNNVKKIHVFYIVLSFFIIYSIFIYSINQDNYSILLITLFLLFILYISIVSSIKESPFSLLILLISTIIFGTIGTYITLVVLKMTSFIERLINIGSIGDWISYSGSIIGGTLTMLAVYFTIKNEKVNRIRDDELKMLPYIEVGIYKNQDFDFTRPIVVINACNYPIRNLKVTTEILIDGSLKNIQYEASYPSFLSVGSEWPVLYSDKLYEYIQSVNKAQIDISFHFEFENLIRSKKYTHVVKLEIDYDGGFCYKLNIENTFKV